MSIETRELSTVDGIGLGPTARSIGLVASPYMSATNVQVAIDTLAADFGNAQSYAIAAETAATNAAGYAAAASGSASAASASAISAADNAALTSADVAEASAQAGIATTQAGLAAASEAAAQGYASAALTSESNASGYATAAAASASAAASYAGGWTGTSASSVAIGLGSKSFTVSTGKLWVVGTPLLISSNADGANFMHGLVTAYTSGSGSLTVSVGKIGGSGTLSDWNISLSGPAGVDGSVGGGDVLGPATNTDDYIPQWNGTNTKTLKNGIDPATLLTTTAAAAAYQPLDTDLTAIAALSTATYGRGLLTLADQAALIAAANGSNSTSVVYVAKTGNDSNSGLIKELPKLTIAAAITAAVALGATKAVVVVLDAGQYTENLTLSANIYLYAPNITLIGTLSMDVGTRVVLDRHYPASSGTPALTDFVTNSGEASFYHANICDGRGLSSYINVDNFRNSSSGRVGFVSCRQMFVTQGGNGFRDDAVSGFGHIHFRAEDIYLAGNNAVGILTNNANTYIIGYVDHILEIGSPTTTIGIRVANSSAKVALTAGEIVADEVYNITNGELYLTCPLLTGTRTGTPVVEISNRSIHSFANAGLSIFDSDSSHLLTITTSSNLSAARTLTIVPGDASRTLTISGNATVSQDYSTTGNPQFATIELGAVSDTTLSRSSAGIIAVEGVTVPLNSTTNTHTAQQIELGHATDTTLTRSAAGILAVEGINQVRVAGNQNLTGGFTGTSYAGGSITGSNQTYTPSCANVNIQHITLDGSSLTGTFTFAAPTVTGGDCGQVIVEVLNSGSGAVAATLSASGYTKADTSAYNTTNGNKFLFIATKSKNYSFLQVVGLQ